jgi:hypothetical protein
VSNSEIPGQVDQHFLLTVEDEGIYGTGVEDEDTVADGKIEKPFDPSLIRIETQAMSLDTVLARIQEAELDLQPGFQRKAGIWKDGAQSSPHCPKN